MTCRGCESRQATGSMCFLESSDCFTWDGDGSEADPFTISPDLNLTAGNLITCGAGSGLLASLPAIYTDPPTTQNARGSNQTIPNNTLTAVSFNIEVYDTDTMHSGAAATRITFTTAGVYIVTAHLIWDNSATGDRTCRIRKNGTDTLVFEGKDSGGSDLYDAHNLTCVEQFSAADYIEVLVQQTSGAALDVYANLGAPVFSAIRRAA